MLRQDKLGSVGAAVWRARWIEIARSVVVALDGMRRRIRRKVRKFRRQNGATVLVWVSSVVAAVLLGMVIVWFGG